MGISSLAYLCTLSLGTSSSQYLGHLETQNELN